MNLLASILLVTPAALALPAPQQSAPADPSLPDPLATCTTRSFSFTGWDLASFALSSTTTRASPSAAPLSVSTLSFIVVSPVLDYTVSCSATAETGGGPVNGTLSVAAEGGGFDGREEFECEPPEEEGAEQDGRVVFSYDGESGEVSLKQRWICRDDPVWPSYFTGSGSGVADVSCTESEDVINENWTADGGEDYSSSTRECAETEVHINLEAIEAVAR